MENDESKTEPGESSNLIINGRNLFQSIGIRCSSLQNNRIDRFLLDFNFNFLPISGLLLYGLLFCN